MKAKNIIPEVTRFSSTTARVAMALLCLVLVATVGTVLAQGKATGKDKAATTDSVARTIIEPGAVKLLDLDRANFDRSENIDHPYWPLKPGMQWIFEGYSIDEGKKVPHRIVFTVTDMVKVIGGVRTRVIFDADYSKGRLSEKELTYFAQDKLGNVWHLGQYREVHEDEFVGGRIWTIDNPPGAKAGIMVPRVEDLKIGALSFSQGYAPPPFNWTDRGRIFQLGQKVKVRAGSYDDVIVFEEFDGEHPGAVQLKYYARGVGNVKIGATGKVGDKAEELELVKTHLLNANELAEVRKLAIELEKRGGAFPLNPPMEQVIAK
jgi:hypothetical protein